jgi:hypothetical protein
MFRMKDDDGGFAMVFVAILLVMLIGLVAFAVDTAALYQERRELQNGADAAVLAIAADCAFGTAVCDTPTAEATADDYADANAGDDAAQIDDVQLDTTSQTIEVTTATETSDGGGIFEPFFAQVIGFDGSHVQARASAAWGAPAGLSTLPIIFSDCEWQKYQGDPGTEDHEIRTVYFHGNTDPPGNGQGGQGGGPGGGPGGGQGPPMEGAEDCHYSPSGQDLPGGFGWLDENTEIDCAALTAIGEWIGIDPGNTPSTGCDPEDMEAILDEEIPIPYFGTVTQDGEIITEGEAISGNGATAEYLVSGYALLHVTGYNFGGQFKAESVAPGPGFNKLPCTGEMRCIEGYFVEGDISSGEIDPGGENRGLIVIKFTS